MSFRASSAWRQPVPVEHFRVETDRQCKTAIGAETIFRLGEQKLNDLAPQIRWFSSDIVRSINLLTYFLTYFSVAEAKMGEKQSRQSSFFSSSVNIQQWASPFTAGVSWLSRPDQLTRLQITST